MYSLGSHCTNVSGCHFCFWLTLEASGTDYVLCLTPCSHGHTVGRTWLTTSGFNPVSFVSVHIGQSKWCWNLAARYHTAQLVQDPPYCQNVPIHPSSCRWIPTFTYFASTAEFSPSVKVRPGPPSFTSS